MPNVIKIAAVVGAVVLAAATTTVVVAAPDDFEIQSSSNAPAHPVGQKLAKGAKLTLPENSQISFFDRTASGSPVTRNCGGKYDGPIDSCRPAAGGKSATTPGATRGAVR